MDNKTALKICKGYKSGQRLTDLVEEYGYSQTTIYRTLVANGVKTNKRIIEYREDVFDVINTELKAYVLGLITADGYIVNKPGRYIVSLGSTDKEIPDFFAELIDYQSNIYHIEAEGVNKRNQDEWRIMVGCKYLVLALNKLGVQNRKSTNEIFCDKVPRSLVRHYIRGIYDGDGSLGLYPGYKGKPQVMISLVGSESMLSKISKVFNRELGTPQKNVRLKAGNLYILSYRGNNIAKIVASWLYTDCTYALPRKMDIAQKIISTEARQWVNSSYGRPVKKDEELPR